MIMYHSYNSLPNDKILDMTKLKAFADDRINEAQMMISVFDGVENIVGKGENAGNQHFLPFYNALYPIKDRIHNFSYINFVNNTCFQLS